MQQQQHVTNDGDAIATSSPLPPLPPLDANITTTEGRGNRESTGAAAEAAATFDNSSSNTVNASNNPPLPALPSINAADASAFVPSSNNNGLHYESEQQHHHQLELSQNPPPLPQLPPPLPGNQPLPPSQYSYSHYSQYPYSAPPTEHQQQQYHYPPQHHQQQLQYPSYPPPPPPPQQPIITTNNNNNQPPINTDRPTYTFSIPTQDTQSLSNRQCYIRTHLIELFIANEEDVQSRPTKGKQKIYCGQVGIRCAYCVGAGTGNDNDGNNDNGSDGGDDTSYHPHDWTLNKAKIEAPIAGDNTTSRQRQPPPPPPPRAERAICYPQSISRIYQTVADMQRRHFEKCPYIPVVVMGTYKSLKSTRPRGENNPAHYWESSAREIGLIDSGGEEKVGIKGIVVDMERFSLQRKNVESLVVVAPTDAATLGNTSTTAQEVDDNGKDYNDTVEQQPRATKRSRSTKEQEETIKSSLKYTATSTQVQQHQPQSSSNASSVSDAHLLASMRDGASSVTPH